MRHVIARVSLLFSPIVVVCLAGIDSSPVAPLFTDVTAGSGIEFLHLSGPADQKNYIFEAKGGGAGFFDFDNDGLQDLYLVQGSTWERFREGTNPHGRLFRNLGNGTFQDVTRKAGLSHPAWGMGVAFGDYDNDGFADIYLTHLGPNVLYRNNGDGTFSDMTNEAGVGGADWSTSAAFGDYDGDGLLDLYVCNYLDIDLKDPPEPGSGEFCSYLGQPVMCGPKGIPGAADVLYRNQGDGTFTDVSDDTGAVDRNRYYGLGVVWSDLDNDGDLDIYVANDATPNLLFLNRGEGQFEERGLVAGLALSGDGREQASMGVDVADYDNDGLMDAFVTHFASDYSTLYRNLGNLIFEDVTLQAGIQGSQWPLVGWGTRFADFNNDGWKDILHSNGHVYPFLQSGGFQERYFQPISLYLNERGGIFIDAAEKAGLNSTVLKAGRGMAFADYDNDGDIDFLVSNLNDAPQLFRNDRRDDHSWIMFKTEAVTGNRDGIGARITLRSGEMRQVWEIKRTVGIYSASDPRAHFGLGGASKADLVSIRWPSGKIQEFRDVAANIRYLIHEDDGLSRE